MKIIYFNVSYRIIFSSTMFIYLLSLSQIKKQFKPNSKKNKEIEIMSPSGRGGNIINTTF